MDPTDGPPPGEHNSFRGVPLITRDEATRASIASLGPAIDADAVTAAWEAALSAPEWKGAPVWIHGDLDSRNMLVTHGRLTAVIDFGCLVLVRDAQRWMTEVLADHDSTSQRVVRD